MEKEGLKNFSGYVWICLLWGSTWLVIRIGLESLTPLFAAGIRFLIGASLIYIIMKIRSIRLQTDPLSMKLYWIMGIFSFVIPFSLVYWAEQYIASGLTAVLFAIYPFFVIIFSRIAFPTEKVDFFKVAGSILGFTGIYFIFSTEISVDISNDFWGMLAVFVSAVMQASIAVTLKKYGKHLNPLSMNFPPVLLAGVVLVITAFFWEDHTYWKFDGKALFSVFYLALFGTIMTFTTYYWLLKRLNVVILSLTAFITPIIAVLLGWLLMDEHLSAKAFLGSSLVLIGILFANFVGIKKYLRAKRQNVIYD